MCVEGDVVCVYGRRECVCVEGGVVCGRRCGVRVWRESVCVCVEGESVCVCGGRCGVWKEMCVKGDGGCVYNKCDSKN